jgi:hypothetical protein
MRKTLVTLSLLLVTLAVPLSARAAEGATVKAILIIATQEKSSADPRLAPYEATLQRNLPESSFRYVGQGSASVAGKGGRASISLGNGHRVELAGGSKDDDGILLKVRWMNGRTVVMNNSFTFQPGVPVVLGRRPRSDGNVPIVILIAH